MILTLIHDSVNEFFARIFHSINTKIETAQPRKNNPAKAAKTRQGQSAYSPEI